MREAKPELFIDFKLESVSLYLCQSCKERSGRYNMSLRWFKIGQEEGQRRPCGYIEAELNINGVTQSVSQDLVDSDAKWTCPNNAKMVGDIVKFTKRHWNKC